MNEHIHRNFYPDNKQEEIDILELRELISEMEGCLLATVCGVGDYHYIETIFEVPFPPATIEVKK